MKKVVNMRNLLLAIVVLAFVFRIWEIGNRDLFGDEGVDAFRGIGYVDYLGTSFQTQPIDWYKDTALPWWTNLSFHDFPPLAMIIQHAFFAVFGDSILVARLPAIVFGALSVSLIYLIARRFFFAGGIAPAGRQGFSFGGKERITLLAAFLFSVNSVMVWIFRTSLLEPTLLFFIILNIYYFFRFLEDKRYWWLFGGTLGLVFLTKYTGVFLVPVYLLYLIFISILRTSDVRRTSDVLVLKNWRLYAAFGLVLSLFTPVLIYNFYLYKTTGHFDLQFAYFLHQNTPEWIGLVGKVQDPFSKIWGNLTSGAYESRRIFSPVVSYQIPFLISVAIGFLYTVYKFAAKETSQEERKSSVFLWLYLIFATLLLFKIGSAHRFLALYGPVFVIFSSVALNWLWEIRSGLKINYPFKFLVGAFLIWEFFYSVNRNFIQVPDYGVAKLDHFLEEEFRSKESAAIPEADNKHLTNLILKFVEKRSLKSPRDLFLIVYNDNVELPTLDWIFYRRFFYHGIPVLFVENFNKVILAQGEDYFKNFTIYFIQSTENTLLNQFKKEKTAGLEFENNLIAKGLNPDKVIYGHNNLPMFRIYLINNF